MSHYLVLHSCRDSLGCPKVYVILCVRISLLVTRDLTSCGSFSWLNLNWYSQIEDLPVWMANIIWLRQRRILFIDTNLCALRTQEWPWCSSLTLELGWACRSSSGACTFWHPTGGPPHRGPWWQIHHSHLATRWHRGTLLSSGAPGWNARAGSAGSLGWTLACRPTQGRQTLGGCRGEGMMRSWGDHEEKETRNHNFPLPWNSKRK